MSDIEHDYPLIPMNDITIEAREIAVVWIESDVRELNDIRDKHKLASDIMNYARRRNALLVEGIKLAITELKNDNSDAAKTTLELLIKMK